jgi:hypothetical protein
MDNVQNCDSMINDPYSPVARILKNTTSNPIQGLIAVASVLLNYLFLGHYPISDTTSCFEVCV